MHWASAAVSPADAACACRLPLHCPPPPNAHRGIAAARPQLNDWLADSLPAGSRVGFDPLVHTVEGVTKLKAKLEVRHATPVTRLSSCLC